MERDKIIKITSNIDKIRVKSARFGIFIKKDFIVIYSGRSNNFPFKKGCELSLTIDRNNNQIKGFNFTNYEKIDYISAQKFIDHIIKSIN